MNVRAVVYRTAFKFLPWLLLLIVKGHVTVSGQGVTVDLNGLALPNNSLVDFDDIPNVATLGGVVDDSVLNCRTDLEACCNAAQPNVPAPGVGEWYYPNGTALDFDVGGATFRRNRGLMNVRLWRRDTPLERGRFHCEVPNAQNVNQTVYVNILNIGPVTITASGGSNTGIAGTSFSLMCSATVETQTDTPTPNFDWFFGTNNGSLPSGATPMATVMGNTYTSTLQFSPLQESHAGMYTCRLGSNARLAVNAVVTVNRPTISVIISDSGSPVLGESGYVLNCDVTGDENLTPTITYQWTRDNGNTQTQVGTNTKLLSFSSLSLSDAGRYTCSVTVSSPYLNSNVMQASPENDVIFQIPNPSIVLTSNPVVPILGTTGFTLNCTVEMAQGVVDSDLSLLMVDAQLSRDGTPLTLTGPTVTGTTFTYTIQLDSFRRNDSGNYTCSATVRPQSSSSYITESDSNLSTSAKVSTGVYLSLRSRVYSANEYILITDVGEGDNSALLCFTDHFECCDSVSGEVIQGEWLFPDGSAVGEVVTADFYVDRGPSVVRLNRRSNATSLSGQFCCQVPESTSTNIRMCVNLIQFDPQTQSGCAANQVVTTAGVTVLVIIVIECLIAIPVILITVMICCKRKSSGKGDISVSANVSYGQVVLSSSVGEYESPLQYNATTNYSPSADIVPAPYEIPVSGTRKSKL